MHCRAFIRRGVCGKLPPMSHLRPAFVGLLLLGLSGCATALRGTKQGLNFETEPTGATVTIDDQTYTTPAKVTLKRKDAHYVVIAKEGYRTIKFKMRPQWDGVSLISLALPGGSIMFATDTASGADRSFANISKIKLEAVTDPNTPPLELLQFRGKLMTQAEYDKAIADEAILKHGEIFEK
jgi:hypothetical protein